MAGAARCWQQASPLGALTVVAGDAGVRRIALPGAPPDVPPDAVPGRDRDVARRLDAWFAGRRRAFAGLAVDLDATGFARAVLETLAREVPWGETVSYGELAEMAGRPRAARAVGRVMAGNPVPFVIPCHRVIAAGGRLGGYGGTAAGDPLALKRWLLAREGLHPTV